MIKYFFNDLKLFEDFKKNILIHLVKLYKLYLFFKV